MSNPITNQSSSNSAPPAIPLIVGVTGHRDLVEEDIPRIKDQVREALRSLKKQYPHTPLVLLSPLAEGADQLVAEVALQPDIAAQLVAVLSWPPSLTLRIDLLARDRDVSRFQERLGQASQIVAMPLDDEALRLAASDEPAFVARQYEQVGKFIARHSQMLIALWDGSAPQSSGTARVVEWQRSGAPAPFSSKVGELDTVEGAPICHIHVRRTSTMEATPPSEPRVEYLYPESTDKAVSSQEKARAQEKVKDEIHSAWANINRFNRDVEKLNERDPGKFAVSRSYVLPEATEVQLPSDLRQLFEFYSLADTVAISYQQRVMQLVKQLFVIGPLAVVCLEVYAHLWSHWVMLAAYLALLAGGYWKFRQARQADWEGRYLDHRALAEALRVQFFWRWAGLTDCAAEHYLRHLRGELGWIRQAARTCFLLTSGSGGFAATTSSSSTITAGSEESLRGVLQHWILDQAKFFAKKAPHNEHLESRCEWITKWSFRAALAIASLELVVHWQSHHANHLLIVLTFLGLVAAALSDEFAEYHLFGILARQYEWMQNLFSTAAKKLEALIATKNIERSQALIHDLGLEALNENADWLVQRRRKPVVLPK